jgi:hypothetical protein
MEPTRGWGSVSGRNSETTLVSAVARPTSITRVSVFGTMAYNTRTGKNSGEMGERMYLREEIT